MVLRSREALAPPNEILAAELERLGVRFVTTQSDEPSPYPPLSRQELIRGLAMSGEARLQMALIPLLIVRPAYAQAVAQVATGLTGPSRVTLVCYYTAARLLQRTYDERLDFLNPKCAPLPDLFGTELNLPETGSAEAMLQRLAQRHADLSGRRLNWYGTYHHAVSGILRQSERL